jgi:hypothetical protein
MLMLMLISPSRSLPSILSLPHFNSDILNLVVITYDVIS